MRDRLTRTRKHLARVARLLAAEQKVTLDALKAEHARLAQPDFLWHSLLQSFATMGRASGYRGLIKNPSNYKRVQFQALASLPPTRRAAQVRETCRAAKVRMPNRKTEYILNCFDYVATMGGPEQAKRLLLQQSGREAKIRFLKDFPGIGDKYARNILMDVHHEEFRDAIAVDVRIKGISARWGLAFSSYADHESFYLSVAQAAGLSGWELDRLMFYFQKRFLPAHNMDVRRPSPGMNANRQRRCSRGCQARQGVFSIASSPAC